MKQRILLVTALLLLAGATFLAADCGCTFQVDVPNGPQVLGGQSGESSHKGLHQAVEKSGGVIEHIPGNQV